jgi:hypothetical protein
MVGKVLTLVEDIKGNASLETKQHVLWTLSVILHEDGDGFADSIGKRIDVKEVDVSLKEGANNRHEAKVICEICVTQGPSLGD